jgi:hypothetical protein
VDFDMALHDPAGEAAIVLVGHKLYFRTKNGHKILSKNEWRFVSNLITGRVRHCNLIIVNIPW